MNGQKAKNDTLLLPGRSYIDLYLRCLNLRQLTDYLIFIYDLLINYRRNRKFRKTYPHVKLPPANLAFAAFNTTSIYHYQSQGAKYAQSMASIIKSYFVVSPQDSKEIRVLDFGCGPGRIVKILPYYIDNDWFKFFASDIDRKSIAWCKRNIKGVDFFAHQEEPPLSWSDNFFDITFARSVFTHLSIIQQKKWLHELGRVTKKQGIVILTTHGDRFQSRLVPGELRQYRSGNVVIRSGLKSGNKCYTVFHPAAYVRKELLFDFRIIDHLTEGTLSGFKQDVWIFTKH